ncbi:hypothetical protein [Arthrobacter ramosus]|uniref:Uncharacterized protein n=1 Tax=Arthrobacter ramosus TaxID=1672 RepID=A0ABV5Y258_ARTRM|nr:hypothetical protein [Arthrobacter ramosus]
MATLPAFTGESTRLVVMVVLGLVTMIATAAVLVAGVASIGAAAVMLLEVGSVQWSAWDFCGRQRSLTVWSGS